jgi:SAM-dependent methyltransferase
MKKDFARQYKDVEKWHWWFRGRRRILECILLSESIDGTYSKRILSIGCGPAEGLKWLVPFAGQEGKVLGLDIEPLHAESVSQSVEFVVGSVEQIPLMAGSFDLVLALDVLEHLDNDSASFREVVRLVKPGGMLLLTVPALPSVWGGQDVVSEHRRRYTRSTLKRLFDEANLSGYRITYFNSLLFPLAAGLRWSRRAIGLGNRARSDFEDNKPGVLNDILAWVFGLESHLINRSVMPIGLSLVATYKPQN